MRDSPALRVRARDTHPTALLSPAAHKAIRHRMLFYRAASLERVAEIAGVSVPELHRYRRELATGALADLLLARGANFAFVRELPQGPLLYLLVRALRPLQIVETGVRPGYSTAWILAALDANGAGQLTSMGPGTSTGRSAEVENVTVGQFVPPALRSRWILELGNTEERLRTILSGARALDLFFYDNGPDALRARFELRSAWAALGDRGVLLAHHTDANTAWSDFCLAQGLPPQILDSGPPPLGALSMRTTSMGRRA